MTNPIERARDIAYGKLTRCPNVCRPDLAITAFLAALAEEGLCIVPREPTEEMLQAAEDLGEVDREWPGNVYRAMLAALNSKENE